MAAETDLILGEHTRVLDQRWRVTLPGEWVEQLAGEETRCTLIKERPGCLSLWNAQVWQTRLDAELQVIRSKLEAGKLQGKLPLVQALGRLLSTRQASVQLGKQGRLLVPEGFRPFLKAEPGQSVVLVGAALCVEIWEPACWNAYLARRLPRFSRLVELLSQ